MIILIHLRVAEMFQNRDIIIKIILFFLDGHRDIFDIALDPLGKIKFYWTLDYTSHTLKAEVHVPSEYTWLAIGFSDRGELFPSDLCVIWTDWKGVVHFEVCLINSNTSNSDVLSDSHYQHMLFANFVFLYS